MADIHVFADMDQIRDRYDTNPMQTIDEAYGPVQSNPNGRYRLTSRFQFNAGTIAYAAFDGIAIIQDMEGFPGLVNLALYNIGINRRFPNPQVMVYRGLLREDFLTGTGVGSQMQIHNRAGFNSDLIVNIWGHFTDWKTTLTSVGQTTSLQKPRYDLFGYMKYDENAPDKRAPHNDFDSVIGQFLRRRSKPNYQPFPIKKGWSIGRFHHYTNLEQIGGGIDILLEGDKHGLNFGELRAFQHDVSASVTGSPGAQSADIMMKREKVLDYIDPAAFYNHFSQSGVDYGSETLTGNEVYDRIINKFYTKNRVYVEIRNQGDLSLNFYQDNMDEATLTDNFKIGFNGVPGSESAKNYYVNYWPVYTKELEYTGDDQNTIQISFRKKFNPLPVVYVDQAIVKGNWGDDRFLYDDTAANANWSRTFEFITPNIPGLADEEDNDNKTYTSTAWLTRLYLIRKVLPDINLPDRTIPANNYLDQVFGSVYDLAANYPPPGGGGKWVIGGTKRYVNGEREFGPRGDFMVQTGVHITDTSIIFFGTLVDKNSRITPGNTVRAGDIAAAEYGTTAGSFANILQRWTGRDEAFIKFLINPVGGGIHEVLTVKADVDYFPEYGMVTLQIPREDYEDRILPAASQLNGAKHPVFFSLDSFFRDIDSQETYFRRALVTVSGLNDDDVYTRVVPSGNILVRSVDRFNFSTEGATVGLGVGPATPDELAYFPANSETDPKHLINFVKAIEEAYAERDLTPKQTVTRIRHQFYGYHYRIKASRMNWGDLFTEGDYEGAASAIMDADKGIIFGESIPSDDNVDIGSHSGHRVLEKRHPFFWPIFRENEDLARRYDEALEYMSALGDENTLWDNPSPIVKDPEHNRPTPRYEWDLGHAMYGLTALLEGGAIKPVYNKFGIYSSIELASYMADMGAPPGDWLVHVINGEPLSDKPHYPDEPDIERYWEIEATDADLIGDAESFGWFAAWQKVSQLAQQQNRSFKFSEVLERYYDPTEVHPEHYLNRWHIFCRHPLNQYINAGGEWIVTGPGDNGPYDDLVNRVRTFSRFQCCFTNNQFKTYLVLKTGLGSVNMTPYDALLTNTTQVYYVINRWLGKVQNWLAAE